MKKYISLLLALYSINVYYSAAVQAQDFQGKAYYYSKSKMNLGSWGARMSEAQKKQIKNRLKKQARKDLYIRF